MFYIWKLSFVCVDSLTWWLPSPVNATVKKTQYWNTETPEFDIRNNKYVVLSVLRIAFNVSLGKGISVKGKASSFKGNIGKKKKKLNLDQDCEIAYVPNGLNQNSSSNEEVIFLRK